MSANPIFELNGAAIVALRSEPEALKAITAQLQLNKMGPADHIRTKHEVKAWIETQGDVKEAEAIVVRARARHELLQTQVVAQKMTERQQQGYRTGD